MLKNYILLFDGKCGHLPMYMMITDHMTVFFQGCNYATLC